MDLCESSNLENKNISEINNEEYDYNCKYEKDELNKKLKYFVNQENIQSLHDEKSINSDDSVYKLVKKDENEELKKFFEKIKISFIKEIDYYLHSQNMNNNVNPLVSQIISNENGNEIYKNKIKRQITKISEDEKSFIINHLTILVEGKTDTGKSTLINALLKLKGNEAATAGGDPINKNFTPYQSKNRPYLRLVDTRGINREPFCPKHVEKECISFIFTQFQTREINIA